MSDTTTPTGYRYATEDETEHYVATGVLAGAVTHPITGDVMVPVDPTELTLLPCDREDDGDDWHCDLPSHHDGPHVAYTVGQDGNPTDVVGKRWTTDPTEMGDVTTPTGSGSVPDEEATTTEATCEHDWQLTEDGYSRTWSTRVHEDGTVTAYYGGSDDFSDDGDGVYLLCQACGAHKDVGPDDVEYV